mmetsp:Transcript_26870/g.67545  ORF Transcript_26870/g.67545 Transcript_26870/m.67545 type:complete len:84 (+) Transcript_26870:1967-2218(+)
MSASSTQIVLMASPSALVLATDLQHVTCRLTAKSTSSCRSTPGLARLPALQAAWRALACAWKSFVISVFDERTAVRSAPHRVL